MKEPFFPTLDLNDAYNPSIQGFDSEISKTENQSAPKASRSTKRGRLVRDIRKDALDEALALEQ